MKRAILSLTALILALLVSPIASAKAAAVQLSKKEVLSRLKTLQDQQIASSDELDKAIRKQLQETLTMQIRTDESNVANRRTDLVTKKIDELNKRREELNARREIVDRLIFQIDSKYSNQPLQLFLEQTFIEMASTDLADGRDSRLWKEFTYLSMVMREAPEANEDVMNVFQGYLNYASVLEPKSPADYLASRNYTNGTESVAAHQSTRANAGDGIVAPATSVAPAPVQEIRAPLKQTSASEASVGTTSGATSSAASLPTPNQQQAQRPPQPAPPTPKTVIVIGKPQPPPTATAPPTPIKASRSNDMSSAPGTIAPTSNVRETTVPASEAQLH